MAFEVNVSPGYVSAFFFVVFDLVLLTVADTALSIYVSRYYLNRILRHGRPLRVRSADIPGVTTFLLGDNIFSSSINIAALLIKLFLLACIFLLDLNLDARYDPHIVPAVYLNTYDFDPSESRWPYRQPVYRRVERQWLQARHCRTSPDKLSGQYNFTLFPLAYNLSEGGVIDDEVVPLPEGGQSAIFQNITHIDTRTMVCMNPESVNVNHDAQPSDERGNEFLSTPLLHVLGCSDTFTTTNASSATGTPQCDLQTNVSVPIDLPISDPDYYLGMQEIPEGTTVVKFAVHRFPSKVFASQFPSPYHSDPGTIVSNLTCTTTHYGPTMPDAPYNRLKRSFTSCAFVVRRDNSTLVELWRYRGLVGGRDPQPYLQRIYRGPVFKGDIPIGTFQTINLLQMAIRPMDWLETGSILFAESLVYMALPAPVHTRVEITTRDRYVVSFVPWYAIALILCVFTASCVGLIVAIAKTWKSTLPQLNTINGVSSIAREERVPSGRSIVRGDPVDLGLSVNTKGEINTQGQLHFGPLGNKNEAVRPIKDVDFL